MNEIIIILELMILITLITGLVRLYNLQPIDSKLLSAQSRKGNSSSLWNNTSSALREQREEFFRINTFFLKMLSEKKSKSNYKRLQKEYMEIGTRLYFFASQNTIRKFLEFKHLSSFVEGTVQEHKLTLLWFAELNLLLRKDLKLNTNPEQIKDYLNILLTYWDEEKLEEKELDELKNKLSQSIDNYYNVHKITPSLN